MADATVSFGGSMPAYYDDCLGPAWFESYGADLAQRLPAREAGDVLEVACGTGIVTRHLRARMHPARRLVASDISRAMLDYASAKLMRLEGIEWCEADAARLPFASGVFSAVVCAFGMMFVPDKPAAFREVRRVLEPGGTFLFNVWDRIEANPAPAINGQVLGALFPGDPDIQLKTPYEMHDAGSLQRLLEDTGFGATRIEYKRVPIESVSAATIALGQVRGTPRAQLLERRGIDLDMVVDKVAAGLAEFGGADPWRGFANALVVQARAA